MPIPVPEHYFEQADKLTQATGAPRQADLRRAVSAAYYGVFHRVVTAAADQWCAAETDRRLPEYGIAYRQIDHVKLKSICNATRGSLGKEFGRLAGMQFSSDCKRFGSLLIELQERRHEADYDPIAKLESLKVRAVVASAREAVGLFDKLSRVERLTFLTLLMFKAR